jgi:hypothetical protein
LAEGTLTLTLTGGVANGTEYDVRIHGVTAATGFLPATTAANSRVFAGAITISGVTGTGEEGSPFVGGTGTFNFGAADLTWGNDGAIASGAWVRVQVMSGSTVVAQMWWQAP